MKKLKRISILFCAVLTLMLCTLSVSAANYTPVAGTTVTLKNHLVVANDAQIPSATFTFRVTAGAAKEATATTAKVWAGINPGEVKVNGSKANGTTVFTPGESTTAGASGSAVTTDTSKKYATKDIVLDFSGVSFTEPGVYRYVLTEDAMSGAITADSVAVRTIDVQVIDNGGTLKVASIVSYSGPVTNGPKTDGTGAAAKSNQYVNSLETHNLTLRKNVSGAGGSVDQYFKFTVEIAGAGNGTILEFVTSGAEKSTIVNTATPYAKTVMDTANSKDDNNSISGQQIVMNASGAATFDVYLHSGQSIVLKGLPRGTTYKITEAESNTNGYTTTGEVKTATAISGADVNVTVANSRPWTPATGLNRHYRDFLLVAGTSIVMIGVLMASKAKKKHDRA